MMLDLEISKAKPTEGELIYFTRIFVVLSLFERFLKFFNFAGLSDYCISPKGSTLLHDVFLTLRNDLMVKIKDNIRLRLN